VLRRKIPMVYPTHEFFSLSSRLSKFPALMRLTLHYDACSKINSMQIPALSAPALRQSNAIAFGALFVILLDWGYVFI
jgi:hypothetical protein